MLNEHKRADKTLLLSNEFEGLYHHVALLLPKAFFLSLSHSLLLCVFECRIAHSPSFWTLFFFLFFLLYLCEHSLCVKCLSSLCVFFSSFIWTNAKKKKEEELHRNCHGPSGCDWRDAEIESRQGQRNNKYHHFVGMLWQINFKILVVYVFFLESQCDFLNGSFWFRKSF